MNRIKKTLSRIERNLCSIPILVLPIALALVLALTACGGGSSPTEPSGPPTSNQNTLTFISVSPPSGSTLKSSCPNGDCPYIPENTVTLTFGYNAIQPVVMFSKLIGRDGYIGYVTYGLGNANPGSGTKVFHLAANSPGTTAAIEITLEVNEGGIWKPAVVLNVPATYTWQ